MLFHSSENDNNKNDTKEVHMNCPQRQSFMIKLLKVLNKKKKKPKMCKWIIKSPQPKPMPLIRLNDKFQGELLMTVLDTCNVCSCTKNRY